MHIVIALRRRVRLFRLGAREGFEKKAPGVGGRSRIARRVEFLLRIALAQQRRVRLLRPRAREGSEKKHSELAAAPEGSKFRVGAVTNRKIKEFPGLGKSISKKGQFKKYNFSLPAPNCTFDSSGARRAQRVRVFVARRPCPATQGSTFSARGARRVREKTPGAGRGSQSARKVRESAPRSQTQRKTRGFPKLFDIGIIECAEGSKLSVRIHPKGAPIWSPLDRMR